MLQVFEYFQQYVKHFHLHKHIKFNTSVISVRKTDDFATTGQWEVKYRDVGGGEEKTQVFDAILACTGHHADKNVPDFPGLDRFKGKVRIELNPGLFVCLYLVVEYIE